MDPGFSNEEREERQERRHDRVVAVLENELGHINDKIRQMQESGRLADGERRVLGDGLRTEIAQLASRLGEEIRRTTTRIESLEQDRLGDRYFKQKLSVYAVAIAGGVAVIWQIVQVIGAWLSGRPP